MLVQVDSGNGGNPHASVGRPSIAGILDSPTLARVERAMLRHSDDGNREQAHLQRAGITQSLLSSSTYDKESTHAIKKGLLWQQRDKLFSRWKERYFILTRDYLHCFRRASGADRISEMGQFLFKIKLVDVERVEWENKKTYSTVALILGRDGKIFLRAPDGLEDWFELLEECMLTSKERRRALRHNSRDEKSKDNNNVLNSLEDWLASRRKLPPSRLPTDSVSTRQDSVRRRDCRNWTQRDDDWENPTLDNRLSLLTDIDISSYDDDTLGAPSVASFRLNQDVFCVQPSTLKSSGSFKDNNRSSTGAVKRQPAQQDSQPQLIKYRERSYSDIQRVDRRLWRPRVDDRFQ
ncbi:uncharacterized protein LOC108733882 [Agrilus planipennis]|uniref:Uncharacterized protein LOC108733882 n=1 Tax=Agrilus planipennis TaxID=224129 RepID=A0A1W4W9R1_AGRPL|nr:uncharacterized protein LOC108733882 [Agrilus planipennis]